MIWSASLLTFSYVRLPNGQKILDFDPTFIHPCSLDRSLCSGMSPAKSGGNGNGKPLTKERRTPCCFCLWFQKMTVLKKVSNWCRWCDSPTHIGILGHLISREEPKRIEPPVVHLPRGPYSSYKIEAGKEGYTIEYRAFDDPRVLESHKNS